MSDPSYPAFSVFAFLGFILVLIPLPWHFQAWNSGTCLYMIWTAIGCLNVFVNSIVWHGNAINWAPVWCDISSRLTLGVAVAIPAASLCINRRLYKIASVQTVSISRAEKKRAVMIDLAIGLGIPFLQMFLQFVVQGHRFNIFEDVGCYPTTFNTPPAYPLTFVWPTVIGLVSGVYCILTLRAFMRRRAQFSQFLSSNHSLTVNRYFRLMFLATVELLFNTPISAYGIYLNATSGTIQPWISWANAHLDWLVVDLVPAVLWRSNHLSLISLELSRWSTVFCALLFFVFFGFAAEARKHYRIAFWAVARCFDLNPPPARSPPLQGNSPSLREIPEIDPAVVYRRKPPIHAFSMSSTSDSLPVYAVRPPPPTSKRESFSTSSIQSDYSDSICPPPIAYDPTPSSSYFPHHPPESEHSRSFELENPHTSHLPSS